MSPSKLAYSIYPRRNALSLLKLMTKSTKFMTTSAPSYGLLSQFVCEIIVLEKIITAKVDETDERSYQRMSLAVLEYIFGTCVIRISF